MFDKMKQLMEFKSQAEKIKKDLEREVVEVEEVHGIRIQISGVQSFQSIDIDESLLGREGKQDLENNLLRSMNAAIKKSQNVAASKMASVMPGLPGF